MKRNVWGTSVLGCLLMAGAVWSQSAQTINLTDSDAWKGRPFLLQLGGHAEAQYFGRWDGNHSSLQEYAKAHSEASYLIFEQSGVLHRLDAPGPLAQLRTLQEPMDQLSAVQRELASRQSPLAEQQRALSAQMRATRDPAEMGRIGHEQGAIGKKQGEIGREQGSIGRQQGVLGRALNQRAQELIDKCLQDGSCPAVGPVAAPAA